jgi:hypothetical protein
MGYNTKRNATGGFHERQAVLPLVPPGGVGTPRLQTFFFWWYWTIGICIIVGTFV